MVQCLECSANFSSKRSLHAHIKVHDMCLADYYCKFFPRKDLLTNEPLQFKRKDEYFSTFFSRRENMLEWLSLADENEAREIALLMLQDRIHTKELNLAPNEVELYFADLPPISEYKRLFGSYSKPCSVAKVTPLFIGKLPSDWGDDFSSKKIYFDSREQKPLRFANSECLKLDTGDYSTMGDDFKNTFVDRKSFDDWCGTLVGDNLNRFEREIVRCKTQDCFLWVVIECGIVDVHQLAKSSYHRPNISYVSHNMRILQHKYKDNLQFVFSGSRENSQLIIPKILCLGDKLWNVDLQFYLNN